jgi:hypothetical protein
LIPSLGRELTEPVLIGPGYTVADIVAKAVCGGLIFPIALRKFEQVPAPQAV